MIKKKLLWLILACALLFTLPYMVTGASIQNANISTLFGTGGHGHTDGAAGSAKFTLPYSITIGNNGMVYVFDTYNNSIRTVHPSGVGTLLGRSKYVDSSGFPKGYYLDGALSSALLNRPADGVINSKGDLFFADSGNSVLRVISGKRVFTFSGTSAGYADGAAGKARFHSPMAVAIDKNDNIYVADTLNNCIRKVDMNGNVTTVAGIPKKAGYADGDVSEALFRAPAGIAVSDDGSVIYVSDTGNHRIRKIERGKVSTLAGNISFRDEDGHPVGGFSDGNASRAMFSLPRGIALADGVLIVADSGNNMIRVVTKMGAVTTIAGTGEPGDKGRPCLEAELNAPRGVSYYEGYIYIADTENNKIKRMEFNPAPYAREE